MKPSSSRSHLFSFFKLRFFMTGGAVLLLLMGFAVIGFGARSSSSLGQEATDSAPPPELTSIDGLGEFEPAGEVVTVSASSSSNSSDRIEQMLVSEGSYVEAGQTLAVLNSKTRLEAALEEAKANVQVAKATLAQVKAGTKQGDIVAQNARFEQAQAELQGQIITQQANISSLRAELEGESIAQEATVARLKAELLDAQKRCDNYHELHRQGAIAEDEKDQFCLAAETAANNLNEGQANLQRIIKTGQENIREAEANLDRTKLILSEQITENQGTLSAISEVRPVDVQVARANLTMARASVQRAEADLELAFIKASISGEVLNIHTKAGELIGDEGILELGDTKHMYVVAEVYETDITQIEVGQDVTVESAAIEETLQGTVEMIGRQVQRQSILDTDPTADSDGRVVEVKIRLNPADSEQASGLTNQRVDVSIHL